MKKKIYINISFLIILFLVAGCTDDFEQLNTPSDQIITDNVSADLLGQAFALSQYAGMSGGSPTNFQTSQSEFADNYVQYFAETAKNFPYDQYLQAGIDSDYAWDAFYEAAAPQLKFVEDFTEEHDMVVRNALVKVWKVVFYQRITDYWGPVIYSEFGNNETSVSYDTQESIYMNFSKILDEAIEVLNAHKGEAVFAQSDLLFDGDVNKWLKFANSVKLRVAMRIRYVQPEKAKTMAEAAVNTAAGGVMVNNDDNATVFTSENSKNPYSTITNWGEFRMSAAMESVLEGYQDPRMGEYYSPAEDGDSDGDGSPYEGFRNGLTKAEKNQSALNSAHSDMGTKYLNSQRGGTNPRLPVMNASEAYFLRAEGALIGWNMGGDTQSLYEEGIRTSLMNRTTASTAEIDAYVNSDEMPVRPLDKYNLPPLTNITVAFKQGANTESKLEQIITQKWIALYPNSLEAFAELRRTGYPRQYERVNSLNPDVGPGEIFRRMTFVPSEFSTNKEAVEAAQQLLMNGDKNSSRVWWDVKEGQPPFVH